MLESLDDVVECLASCDEAELSALCRAMADAMEACEGGEGADGGEGGGGGDAAAAAAAAAAPRMVTKLVDTLMSHSRPRPPSCHVEPAFARDVASFWLDA
eukprot:COSAG01_NODE_1262_length_10999_cov_12.033853_13_plen_100_part_00